MALSRDDLVAQEAVHERTRQAATTLAAAHPVVLTPAAPIAEDRMKAAWRAAPPSPAAQLPCGALPSPLATPDVPTPGA